MNAQTLLQSRNRNKRRQGFSLMELMTVLAITSVLAAIAIPTFTGYVQKSRTSEAVQFLGVIKLRQEAFRAEFGQYLVCNGVTDPSTLTNAAFIPAFGTPASASRTFPVPNACFDTLGAKPDAAVRFGYAWAAGTPAQAAGTSVATDYGLAAPFDHYFVAQARADLNDNGTFCMFELASFTRAVYIANAADGTPLAKGWE